MESDAKSKAVEEEKEGEEKDEEEKEEEEPFHFWNRVATRNPPFP